MLGETRLPPWIAPPASATWFVLDRAVEVSSAYPATADVFEEVASYRIPAGHAVSLRFYGLEVLPGEFAHEAAAASVNGSNAWSWQLRLDGSPVAIWSTLRPRSPIHAVKEAAGNRAVSLHLRRGATSYPTLRVRAFVEGFVWTPTDEERALWLD